MVHEIIQTPTQLHSVEFYDSIQTRGQNIDHLSYRVQLVEGLFYKYAQDKSGRVWIWEDAPRQQHVSPVMVQRQRPSHRIRRAGGPTRPALGPLAQF
jgi:hypothetical protein